MEDNSKLVLEPYLLKMNNIYKVVFSSNYVQSMESF